MQASSSNVRARNQPLEVWRKIKGDLIEILDSDEVIQREFNILSDSKLGGNVKTGKEFFEVLDNNFSEHCDVVECLIYLTEEINLHLDDGSTKVATSLRQYLQSLRDYDRELSEKGLGTKCFVGRDRELDQVIQTLTNKEDGKGLLLHGMGGMGKTSLAVEACRRLFIEYGWNIYKIDLREQMTLRDLVCSTLSKLGESLTHSSANESSGDHQMDNLKNLLVQRCSDQTTDTVFFFDNVDEILTNDKEAFLNFAQRILKVINICKTNEPRPKLQQIRFLFTARERLLGNFKAEHLLGDFILEFEIGGLEETAAINLFHSISELKTDPDTVKKILSFCGNCPLAILSLCNSIRNSHMLPDDLLHALQMTEDDAGGFDSFGVEACLRQSFDRLDENLQRYLVMLSVFRTAKFDIGAATAIAGRIKSSGKAVTRLDMVRLKSRHFVEMAFEDFSIGRPELYSLHPLVVQFLVKKCKIEPMAIERFDEAKKRFIGHFDGLMEDIALDFHTHPVKSLKNLAENKSHIQHFYNYVMNTSGTLRQACVDLPRMVGETRKDELRSFVLDDHERHKYYDHCIHFAEENGLVLDEIFFKTSKARLYFEIDRHDESEKILQNIEGTLANKDIPPAEFNHVVLAAFYWMKGRDLNMRCHYSDALTMMKKSLSLYQKEPKLCKTEIGNVYNSIGVVYYNQKDYERSKEYHEKAAEVAKQVSRDDQGVGMNLQVFYTNIATALFAQYQKAARSSISEEENRHLLTKAEEYYTLAINHDPKPSEDRAKKLANRGKLYQRMKSYDAAEQDLLECLHIREKLLVPPNVNLTYAYHNLGRFYISKGKDSNIDTYKQAECFVKAKNNYEEGKLQIRRGGLMVTDPAYKDIKDSHLLTLKTLASDEYEQVKQFYADFEAGKFNKKMRKERSIDETMIKSERLASTGKSFEKTLDSESSQSESEDDSRSSSSSGRSSSIDITDDENNWKGKEDDDFSDENTSKPLKGNVAVSTSCNDVEMHSQTLADSSDHRQCLDSGVGSWTSTSHGSSVDAGDVASKRRRLVSMASGSLEDNVFTNEEK